MNKEKKRRKLARRIAKGFVRLYALGHGIKMSFRFKTLYNRCADYLSNCRITEPEQIWRDIATFYNIKIDSEPETDDYITNAMYCLRLAHKIYCTDYMPTSYEIFEIQQCMEKEMELIQFNL